MAQAHALIITDRQFCYDLQLMRSVMDGLFKDCPILTVLGLRLFTLQWRSIETFA